MKSKDELIINLNVNSSMVILVLIGLLLGFVILAVSAQDNTPPTTNTVQTEGDTRATDQASEVLSNPADLHCNDNLIPTTNGECLSVENLGVTNSSANNMRGVATASGGGQHFYLTNTFHFPDQALIACASGYHMASLWEILDVSNLSYDYDHPDAHTKDDSGFGPPSSWYGWIRTGWSSSTSTTTGTGNCQNWSSRSGSDSGVSVRLSRLWETAPGDIAPWDASSFSCNLTGPVWCMGD